MLKKLYFLFVAMLVLALAGCAGAGAPAGQPQQEEAAEEAPAEEAEEEEAAAEEVEESEPAPSGEKVTLTIESWRNDDLAIWQDVLIPAFNAHHPDIEVVFAPTAPAEYNSVLNTKLGGGTAGDLITCRPFDTSLGLYEAGYLASLNDLSALDNFGDVAKSAWITDDGSDIYCVPMASVIHGFLYNTEIFSELGLAEPATEAEFFEVLETIKADGSYAPLVMGTIDQWEAATMGFQNIGPNYWQGEAGRLGLVDGTEKFTDPQYVATWAALAKWGDYLASGYEAQTYPDSQNLFSLGRGAIYPSGSWDIALFNDQADFDLGAFAPPVPEGSDTCYISDHTDIALGMNADAAHPAEAKIFLEWLGTAEFAELYGNQLPGFFSLSNHSVSLSDPVAQEFVDWRNDCESTIRNSYQILSRGEPNLETELWRTSALVINGEMTAEEAADTIQTGLEKWYDPAAAGAMEEEPEEAMEESASGDAPTDFMSGGFLERAYAGEFAGTTVTLDGAFVDDDEVRFNEGLVAFEEATGIDIQYIGSKEFEASSSVRVDGGDAPDIADFPQPGLLASFVRQGQVVDPTTWMSDEWLKQQYNQSWLDMATMEGQSAGVWHRFGVKSLVWYPKAQFDAAGYEAPQTWDELLDLTQTIADDGDPAWCIGIESGAATGWVATDWTEEMLLRTAPPETYDKWVSGELPFSSPEVKNAIETWSDLWLNDDYVYGGRESIVTIFIGDSPASMFEDPPKCWLHRQASWITGFFPEGMTEGVEYDFFYFPPKDEAYGNPWLIAGDTMAMFNDRPEVRAVMEYFTTPESLSGFLEQGGAMSAHQTATTDMYGQETERKIGAMLADATSFRFDASDLMPGEVGAGSFWKGMTDYVSGAADLDTVLQEIDDSWPE